MRAPLLIEIGCEEIPARMIRSAADELSRRVERILDDAGFERGAVEAWGGARRLAVSVAAVGDRLADRDERVLGPPEKAGFDADGRPTKAAAGFARKHGVDPADLGAFDTERGRYVGFVRHVVGATLGQALARDLPAAVAGMNFPKSMRWADGSPRWVRPVHWLVVLHGESVLPVEVFGVVAGSVSRGHRFLHEGAVEISHPDSYAEALAAAHVVIDPAERCERLRRSLDEAAKEVGGRPVPDAALLDEIADLVEWPGVALGRFEERFLDLPRELLVTTLRHHQKCFSVQDGEGRLLPAFLAVANTDRDPAGHVRRGNEWVVGGRLDDARFFWSEDRKRPLASRADRLGSVVFHAKAGSYADRAVSMERIAREVARRVDLTDDLVEAAAEAARLAKVDLVTGTVGEFPELQGVIGGLLLRAEGAGSEIADAVYSHYRPEGPDDDLPPTKVGRVLAIADKLDAIARLIDAGERPTGSRDPFGLRRASSGLFRIAIESRWPLSIDGLVEVAAGAEPLRDLLMERLQNHLRDRGATTNEVTAVMRPRIDAVAAAGWELPDIAARLATLSGVRERDDFAHLVDLTKRVDNILVRNADTFAEAERAAHADVFEEREAAALALSDLVEARHGTIVDLQSRRDYGAVVELLAEFVDPVERFFDDVLVIDAENPNAMLTRRDLLSRLRAVLTRCFDIRELAGQAERRS